MKIVYFVFFFALIALSKAQKVNFKDCGSQVGKIEKLEVFPCTSFPCALKKGHSYTINITFVPTESTDICSAKVYGIIDGIKVPFPIGQPDGCKNSGLTCPLQSGKTYVYTATLPVHAIYPSVKVLVQWILSDKATGGNMLVCLETLVQIVP